MLLCRSTVLFCRRAMLIGGGAALLIRRPRLMVGRGLIVCWLIALLILPVLRMHGGREACPNRQRECCQQD